MENRYVQTFPPALSVGERVWTEHGYLNHGPLEGPKVDIAPNQGGAISAIEKPYYTMDQLLYPVRWDNGQASKHYYKELFWIGRFQTREEFEIAVKPTGAVELTVGPAGGFRRARFELEYDGQSQTVDVLDRSLWLEFIEPLVTKAGLEISTTKLKRGE